MGLADVSTPYNPNAQFSQGPPAGLMSVAPPPVPVPAPAPQAPPQGPPPGLLAFNPSQGATMADASKYLPPQAPAVAAHFQPTTSESDYTTYDPLRDLAHAGNVKALQERNASQAALGDPELAQINKNVSTAEQHTEEDYARDAAAIAKKQREGIQRSAAHVNAALDEASDLKVDPSHWWTSKPVFDKFATGIGVFLANFGSGMRGGDVLAGNKWVNEQINRDVQTQIANNQTKKEAVTLAEKRHALNVQALGDEAQAGLVDAMTRRKQVISLLEGVRNDASRPQMERLAAAQLSLEQHKELTSEIDQWSDKTAVHHKADEKFVPKTTGAVNPMQRLTQLVQIKKSLDELNEVMPPKAQAELDQLQATIGHTRAGTAALVAKTGQVKAPVDLPEAPPEASSINSVLPERWRSDAAKDQSISNNEFLQAVGADTTRKREIYEPLLVKPWMNASEIAHIHERQEAAVKRAAALKAKGGLSSVPAAAEAEEP